VSAVVCDELPHAFGWIEDHGLRRTAHAVRTDAGVWVIDPFDADGMEDRVRALGEPVGVLQLLDRHGRDCEAWADRLGVPLHVLPARAPAGAGFGVVPVLSNRLWREVALWFPDTRTLVCADALATARPYRAPGEPAGVHALLRPFPPWRLGRHPVEHLLVGHGRALHGAAAGAGIEHALSTARWRLPRFVLGLLRPYSG
jgi:hypothetical protein